MTMEHPNGCLSVLAPLLPARLSVGLDDIYHRNEEIQITLCTDLGTTHFYRQSRASLDGMLRVTIFTDENSPSEANQVAFVSRSSDKFDRDELFHRLESKPKVYGMPVLYRGSSQMRTWESVVVSRVATVPEQFERLGRFSIRPQSKKIYQHGAEPDLEEQLPCTEDDYREVVLI